MCFPLRSTVGGSLETDSSIPTRWSSDASLDCILAAYDGQLESALARTGNWSIGLAAICQFSMYRFRQSVTTLILRVTIPTGREFNQQTTPRETGSPPRYCSSN